MCGDFVPKSPLENVKPFSRGKSMKRKTRMICHCLRDSIHQLAAQKDDFCRKPGIDFSRTRSFSFEDMIRYTLTLHSQSIQTNLNHIFNFSSKTPTKSAFIQQREKILPQAFSCLFRCFTDAVPAPRRFHGYRLLACDGSDVNLPRNPQDTETSCQANPIAKSYNMIHINALFDLLNHIYVDYSIDVGFAAFEAESLRAFSDRITDPQTIYVADRGYCNYQTILKLQQNNGFFVIRAKDINSNGLLRAYNLPDDEFDVDISRTITAKLSRAHSEPERYVYVAKRSLKHYSDGTDIPFQIRVVRFSLPDGSFQAVVTNLSRNEFPTTQIKQIYRLRWGIETAFRQLKYAVDLMHFHSKRFALIQQEIHAAFILFNFCSAILQSNPLPKDKKIPRNHIPNFPLAADSCRNFILQNGNAACLNLLYMNPSAIRPGRFFPRYLHDTKPAPSFNYRAS